MKKVQTKKRRKPLPTNNYHKHGLLYLMLTINAGILLLIFGLSLYLLVNVRLAKSVQSQASVAGYDNYVVEKNEENAPVLGQTNSSDVILHGPRNKKNIAITFDAEMTTGMRETVLSGKSSYDIRWTPLSIQ